MLRCEQVSEAWHHDSQAAKAGRIPSFRIGTCVRFDPKTVGNWLREM
jgi:hypothetical protein